MKPLLDEIRDMREIEHPTDEQKAHQDDLIAGLTGEEERTR